MAFQFFRSCFFFCFCVEKETLLSHGQRRTLGRTFPKFGSVKLQGSEDPIQKPVYPACRLSLHQPPGGKGKIDGSVGNANFQCRGRPKRKAASNLGGRGPPMILGPHFTHFFVGSSAPVAQSSSFPVCVAGRAPAQAPGRRGCLACAHKQMSRRYCDNVTRTHVCIER